MLNTIGNFFGRKPAPKSGPLIVESCTLTSALQKDRNRGPSFSKVFRWRLPDGLTDPPTSVEVVGTFTQWQKVPLVRDSARGSCCCCATRSVSKSSPNNFASRTKL
jgi:hypothetical protein